MATVLIDMGWHFSTSTYLGSSAFAAPMSSSNTVYQLYARTWGTSARKISDAMAEAPAEYRGRVSLQAFEAAVNLLNLLSKEPEPQITVEFSGEVSFEWYKDRRHVAVLSVDGSFVRWAAVTGQATPISGAVKIGQALPAEAIDAVHAAL